MRSLVVTVALLCSSGIYAQQDSIRNLNEVSIISTQNSQQIFGTRIDKLDSVAIRNAQGLSLSEVLSQSSGVYIKNYGPGSLSSSSLRGGNASQTQLYWGNLNIQNPMLGQNDLSLFPAFFFENIQIAYGGNGGIYLNNPMRLNHGFSVKTSVTVGSFGNFQPAFAISNSGKSYSQSIKYVHRTLENNYPYLNNYLEYPETQKLTHSKVVQDAVIAEHTQFFDSALKLSLKGWLQLSDRQLPPTLAQKSSAAIEKDASGRWMAELSRSRSAYSWTASAGLFKDRIFYQDEVNSSDSKSLSAVQQFEFRQSLTGDGRFDLLGKITNTYTTALSENYGSHPTQNRTLIQPTLAWRSDNLKHGAHLGLKQELLAGKKTPVCPMLGFNATIYRTISAFGNFSRIYRLPTFNDQFWNPGGNPDLLPESGYSEEIGVKAVVKKGFFSVEESSSLFNKNIQNWIIWLPGDNYWSPTNLMQVWSRGVETKWKLLFGKNDHHFSLSVLTNYIVSTNQKARLKGDEAVGRQLIYTPLYSAQATFTYWFKNSSVSYNHSYTGYTYTSSDNLSYLKPYHVSNIFINQKIYYKQHLFDLAFKVLNVFNTDYQTVSLRPMPGRNFLFAISFSFNKPNNHD